MRLEKRGGNIPVKIDRETCIGCGLCASLCPQVFQMSGEKASVINPKGKEEGCAKEAAESCPVGAIKIE